ncbi:MAG TPA: class I SAM-dependent methyltransferase [Pseudolabrys sp.]|nr:class I SAM-dependent methyltransferase [Pseudolabrys sp.]
MSDLGRQAHWENVYATKDENAVSWFQERADISLELIRATGVNANAAIIDIGAGASRLVDALISEGFRDITILDVAEKALAKSKARVPARGAQVQWVVADVTTWEPTQKFDVWHDRAALHFLTEPSDRNAYAKRVQKAVRTGGHVIIGTFAPDGPERCSGLPVVRHDAASLGEILGHSFTLVETRRHEHVTPTSNIQRFQFSRFQRIAA